MNKPVCNSNLGGSGKSRTGLVYGALHVYTWQHNRTRLLSMAASYTWREWTWVQNHMKEDPNSSGRKRIAKGKHEQQPGRVSLWSLWLIGWRRKKVESHHVRPSRIVQTHMYPELPRGAHGRGTGQNGQQDLEPWVSVLLGSPHQINPFIPMENGVVWAVHHCSKLTSVHLISLPVSCVGWWHLIVLLVGLSKSSNGLWDDQYILVPVAKAAVDQCQRGLPEPKPGSSTTEKMSTLTSDG